MLNRSRVMLPCVLLLGSIPGVAFAQSAAPSASEEPPAPTGTAPTPGTTPAQTTETQTTSTTTASETHVAPSTIAATPAPVPPPTSGERAAATASQPADTHANRPHEEDNGRQIDFIFIQPEFGFSMIDATALSSNGRILPGLTEMRQTGYGGGATIGFRSWIFAVAAHGYISRFVSGSSSPVAGVTNDQSFDVGQVMLEGHLRIPLPVIEPYIRVGLGYAWLGAFQINSMYESSTSDVHGFTGKVGAGIDIWLGKYITIGAGADFSLMNLRRGGVNRGDSVCPSTDPTCIELRQDGDAFGWLFTAHVQAGLHF